VPEKGENGGEGSNGAGRGVKFYIYIIGYSTENANIMRTACLFNQGREIRLNEPESASIICLLSFVAAGWGNSMARREMRKRSNGYGNDCRYPAFF